jgi:hypothetical protein
MDIFTFCKKSRGYFVELSFWYAESIFIAIEDCKGFSKTPE